MQKNLSDDVFGVFFDACICAWSFGQYYSHVNYAFKTLDERL